MDESSLELVRRVHAGDRGALEALFRRYVPALRRWAGGRLPAWARHAVDTDDLIQETLIGTMGRLDSFQARGDGAFEAYLRQVLKNRIIDAVRKARRSPDAGELAADPEDRAASPLEQAIGREAFERYQAALDSLSAADRESIVARVELGLGYERIARALNKPSPDAARMAVSRALVRLAREMGRG